MPNHTPKTKEEVYVLIDKNAGKSVNYVGIHKHLQGAKHHQFHRELKTKKGSTFIRKGYIVFEESPSPEV
jgi:hypothetical protein